MEKPVRLELKIPKELKHKLKVEAALQDFESVNKFIISILESYLINSELVNPGKVAQRENLI